MAHLSIFSLGDDESLPQHPTDEANDQRRDAFGAIDIPDERFLHLPWRSLDDVVGGIAPGQVWFVGAYSGHGKTTFLMSALDEWFNQGKRIYYMGLESQPYILRTQWACRRLGYDSGEVLSGKAGERADWLTVRAKIKEELRSQAKADVAEQVYFSPAKFVDAAKLKAACIQAHALQSDVLIIDHVDHLEGRGGLYESSVQSMKTLLGLAQEFGLKVIAATQFNNEMIKGNRLGLYTPPSATAVYMGNHKRHVASGMLGLYRPLKFDGLTAEDLKKFARGELEPKDVIEPGVMAVSLMKHRLFGNREGKRVFLRVDHGRVGEMSSVDMLRTRDADGFRAAI